MEAFLGTVSLGAIWSSCSPDFGAKGMIERFSQINPKVLFVVNYYFYNGKKINVIERIPQILKEIKSIKYVIVVDYPGSDVLKEKISLQNVKVYKWNKLIEVNKIRYPNFNFEHPLAILYSSGTTGKPKCICHRTGGVLLQHKKEHLLHCDIKENDNVFYFTTCGIGL